MNYTRPAVVLVLALFLLWRNLSGALLFVAPRLVRIRRLPDDAPEVDQPLFEQMEAELAPLGFRRLGAHLEKPPLRKGVLNYDFVHESEGIFASAVQRGRDVQLYLLSPFENRGFVLTADHKRLGVDQGTYLAGGLPGAKPSQVLAAHRLRIERLGRSGLHPLGDLSMEARLMAAEHWFAGAGVREMRLRHANGLILSLMAVIVLASLVGGLLRAAQ